ncbi:MAG TPA: diaminopropionate ammonia-lyase [Candidatus Ornithospirochaeta avicola]|uniref:Diaminopropionate ammonia-lyase n=1 Tax=Candidatus Ornithospirochaeta avicola TaxID=2840896 RepID=A0A9D1PV21_9SPIO|nr:diaminopropionate ammonia-lyase [Candidatus Ornithospirochaeta avicola]
MRDFDYIVRTKKKDYSVAEHYFDISYARDARRFHRQIPGYKVTPLVSLENLAQMLGLGGIYVKDEQKRLSLNSFKVMGGSYAVYRLLKKYLKKENEDLSFNYLISDEIHSRIKNITLASATDGNHGKGIAWAAQQLRLRCVIYVHKETSQPRIDAIKRYGAEVIVVDGNYDDAVRQVALDAKKNGWTIVSDTSWPGYEEIPSWIMQGYTTIMLEAQEEFAGLGIVKPTHIFVQAGVGALAAATIGFYASLFKENSPKFIVVEPDKAACIFETAKYNDGELHSVKGDLDTIMAGLACGDPSPIAWKVLDNTADCFIKVPDYTAARGMRILAVPLSGDPFVISGESGAVPLGTLYSIMTEEGTEGLRKVLGLDEMSNVLVINTEGNTDPIHFRQILWDGLDNVPHAYLTKH